MGMGKKVIVIGKNANLARSLREIPETSGWTFLSHFEIGTHHSQIRNSDVVINLAFHPEISKTGRIDQETDVDVRIARQLVGSEVHLITISTRQIYGNNRLVESVSEQDDLRPETPYAQAKAAFEKTVREVLPEDRVTTLRLTNTMVQGIRQSGTFEYFFTSLATKGKIILTADPEKRTDFIDSQTFNDALIKIARQPQGGIFNLGSGYAVPLLDVAQALAKGFGGEVQMGKDLAEQPRSPGSVMNISRLRDVFDVKIVPRQEMLERFADHGRWIAKQNCVI